MKKVKRKFYNFCPIEQMFRRMVFNVIARNCDDHTKNFAFRLKKDGHWELAPAYDLCHAYKPNHQWVSQHALSVNGKRKDIKKSDLWVIGKSIHCKQAAEIIDEIESVVMDWGRFASEVGVSKELREAIDATIKDWN
jgi:serine/threonine-protein kinase HipA